MWGEHFGVREYDDGCLQGSVVRGRLELKARGSYNVNIEFVFVCEAVYMSSCLCAEVFCLLVVSC